MANDTPPIFFNLEQAAKELGLSTDTVLGLGQSREIELYILIPWNITVWKRVEKVSFKKARDRLFAAEPSFKLLDLSPEACQDLLGCEPLPVGPLFRTGYLQPPFQPHLAKYQPHQTNKPFNINELLPMGGNFKRVNLSEISNNKFIESLPIEIITYSGDDPTTVSVDRANVVVLNSEIERYLANRLSLPASKLTIHPTTTPYLIELDTVARKLYAMTCLRQGHYPRIDEIRAEIRKMPALSKRESESTTYLDIVETARKIVNFKCIQNRGKRLLPKDTGYVSEYLKIVMDAANELQEQISDPIDINNYQLINILIKKGLPESIAERCRPFLKPD